MAANTSSDLNTQFLASGSSITVASPGELSSSVIYDDCVVLNVSCRRLYKKSTCFIPETMVDEHVSSDLIW